jgi:hypothetical protein
MPPSESYRPLLRLFHTDFTLEAFPYTDDELKEAGVLGEGESRGDLASLSDTYHLHCRRSGIYARDN